jgi:hypothetical protein
MPRFVRDNGTKSNKRGTWVRNPASRKLLVRLGIKVLKRLEPAKPQVFNTTDQSKTGLEIEK